MPTFGSNPFTKRIKPFFERYYGRSDMTWKYYGRSHIILTYFAPSDMTSDGTVRTTHAIFLFDFSRFFISWKFLFDFSHFQIKFVKFFRTFSEFFSVQKWVSGCSQSALSSYCFRVVGLAVNASKISFQLTENIIISFFFFLNIRFSMIFGKFWSILAIQSIGFIGFFQSFPKMIVIQKNHDFLVLFFNHFSKWSIKNIKIVPIISENDRKNAIKKGMIFRSKFWRSLFELNEWKYQTRINFLWTEHRKSNFELLRGRLSRWTSPCKLLIQIISSIRQC